MQSLFSLGVSHNRNHFTRCQLSMVFHSLPLPPFCKPQLSLRTIPWLTYPQLRRFGFGSVGSRDLPLSASQSLGLSLYLPSGFFMNCSRTGRSVDRVLSWGTKFLRQIYRNCSRSLKPTRMWWWHRHLGHILMFTWRLCGRCSELCLRSQGTCKCTPERHLDTNSRRWWTGTGCIKEKLKIPTTY